MQGSPLRLGEIVGAREAIRELKGLEPKLARQTQARMRRAAQPLQQAARSALPSSTPMSGWTRGRYAFDPGAARSGVKIKTRTGRASKKMQTRSSWPLVTLSQNNAAGVVFDMAGRRSGGSSPQGRQFIANLNRRHGAASRSMWPAAEGDGFKAVQQEVGRAVEDAARQVNRKIGVGRR